MCTYAGVNINYSGLGVSFSLCRVEPDHIIFWVNDVKVFFFTRGMKLITMTCSFVIGGYTRWVIFYERVRRCEVRTLGARENV